MWLTNAFIPVIIWPLFFANFSHFKLIAKINQPQFIETKNFTHIPVVLSSDNEYAKYMYVTMYSMLSNAHPETHYDFHLLISDNFKQEYEDKILTLKQQYRCSINFIKMETLSLKTNPSHWPPSAYYRLFIADLLPDCDKCIYLDVDIIVLKDLSKLYNIDLENHYIAGVIDFPVMKTYAILDPRIIDKFVDLLDRDRYINSGVLVMNLELIRKNKVTTKFKKMVKYGIDGMNPFPYADQDIINLVCKDHIKNIDIKYNFMSNFVDLLREQLAIENRHIDLDLEKTINNPTIIHYAVDKPWDDKSLMFAEKWWKYAHETPYFQEISEN